MIKSINKAIKLLLFGVGGLFLWSCESDPDDLGAQLFQNNTAEGVKTAYDLVAYNIFNDSIRADGRISSSIRKDTIVLGAFSEEKFGGQKASFVTQLRMNSYAPTFGNNATIDSVVMVLKPQYYTTENLVTTTTDENFIWGTEKIAAKKVEKTYPIYKYGKTETPNLTINVYEVNDFLGSASDMYFSNKVVNTGAHIGKLDFKGIITSVDITKDSDNSSLLSEPASIKINLDKNFFKTKILDKEGSSELSNLSNFIRYFKGIKVSVSESDGYLMKLGISNSKIDMHYSYGEANARQTGKLTFDLGTSNASFSQIDYNRSGAEVQNAGYNTTQGDTKLYVQGMGGNNIGVKIPQTTINALKEEFRKNKVGILSAKMRFYTDNSWTNNYPKPTAFTIMQDKKNSSGKTLYEFLSDMSSYSLNSNFALVKGYNLKENTAYYDITITETLKKLVETNNHQNYNFVIKLGEYLVNSNSQARSYYGQNIDSRLYSPQRLVLVGSDTGNDKRAQLLVTYAKK